MSGATLIAIAIAAFVLLVSAQVFKSWPIAGLGGGESDRSHGLRRARRRRLGRPPTAGAATRPVPRAGQPSAAGNAVDAGRPPPGQRRAANPATTGARGRRPGRRAARPAARRAAAAPTGPAPAQQPASQRPGGGGGCGGSGGGGRLGGSGSSTSGQLTETRQRHRQRRRRRRARRDPAAKAASTEVTEGVVNGVAGPESTVGGTVDETVEGAVGGLLPGSRLTGFPLQPSECRSDGGARTGGIPRAATRSRARRSIRRAAA